MKQLRRRLSGLGLLLSLLLLPAFLGAQEAVLPAFREEYMAWDDFLMSYLGTSLSADDGGDGSDAASSALLEELESLHAHPLNINRATRAELLQLPFLDGAQADSLLSYRAKKHGRLLTLGELQFVPGLDFTDRCRLSLFVYAGEAPDSLRRPLPSPRLWRDGRHEVLTRFDLPLYRVRADVEHTAAQVAASPNKYYEGYRWANTTRYAYRYRRALRYGVTLQKDSGEPFGTKGTHTYPFDYNAFHFYLRPEAGRYELAVGDYRVRYGQGLLVGDALTLTRTSLLGGMSLARARLTPHASTDESRFLRGVAGSYTFPIGRSTAYGGQDGPSMQLQVSAFGSYRRLDGTVSQDTLTSFKTDGLHRTLAELDKRGRVGQWLMGGRVQLEGNIVRPRPLWKGQQGFYKEGVWTVGVTAAWSRYTRVVWPAPRPYNLYWLRGRDAAGGAADYAFRLGRWAVQGELALDRKGHPATTHTVRWRLGVEWAWYAQCRALSSRYVSPWGTALAQNSRLQNELALLSGFRWTPDRLASLFTLEAYAEAFRWPRPVYRLSRGGNGFEAFVRPTLRFGRRHSLMLTYRFKTREYDVAGTDLQQLTGLHRLRLQWSVADLCPSLSLTVAADGSLYATQTAAAETGLMLSSRAAWKALPDGRLTLSAFAALFTADSYAARLYAYRPHLQQAGGSASYSGQGAAAALVVEGKVNEILSLGLQYNLLHYFNRSTTGSGITEADGPSRHDLHFQLRLLF